MALPRLPRSVRALATVLAALGILAASVTRPGAGPGPPLLGFEGADEVRHALSYAVLGLLVAWSLLHRRWSPLRRLLVAAGLAFSWGVVVEVVQFPLAYRTASPLDATANLVGAAVGAAAWVRWGQPRVELPDPGA
jgi:VanZ family protein